jgi:hypothetical protein
MPVSTTPKTIAIAAHTERSFWTANSCMMSSFRVGVLGDAGALPALVMMSDVGRAVAHGVT